MAAEPPVRVRGLGKSFGRTVALDSVDLDVLHGEVLGLLGPNGAGKTTLIRVLLGMLRPSAGTATLFGLDALRDAARVHRRLAYVPGETAFWPELTGTQILELLGRLHGHVDEAYRAYLLDRFDLDPRRRVREYSKGNRQKLALVAAFGTRADLLVLDEPTSGLDPLMEQVFRECVRQARERGQTVLLSSHILNEVEQLCDRVAILRAGRLVELGTLTELRHLSALQVQVVVDGALPVLDSVPGVSHVVASDSTVTLQVRGSMAPLVAALDGYRVVKLISREPSLEEVFLDRYGADTAGPDDAARSRAQAGAR